MSRGTFSRPGRGWLRALPGCVAAALSPLTAHAACTTVGGDLVLGGSAVLKIDVAGREACSEHDRLTVQGTLRTSPGATFRLVLAPSFLPEPGDRFRVLAWGARDGVFERFDTTQAPLPQGSRWDFSRLETDGEIAVQGPPSAPAPVPLPASFLGLFAGLLPCLHRFVAGHAASSAAIRREGRRKGPAKRSIP